MQSRIHALVALAVWYAVLGSAPLGAADESRQADEEAIRAAAQKYVAALEQGDAQTLRDTWVADGDIVDAFGQSAPAGEVIRRETEGRAAAVDPAVPRRHVEIKESKIRFLTDDVAIEDGRVNVPTGIEGVPPVEGRFSAVWVKGDGTWRLATLREARVPQTPGADLAALDWMVGDWTGELGKATFDVATRWNDKHTYLIRDLTVKHDGKVVFSGGQRIGIDPLDGKIKSWMHDADGGHGEGAWTRHGDVWTVLATGVTPDGRRTSATNIYVPDGADGMSWKSTAGFSDGQPVPGFEINLKRVATSAKRDF